jgi:hypothetical protein
MGKRQPGMNPIQSDAMLWPSSLRNIPRSLSTSGPRPDGPISRVVALLQRALRAAIHGSCRCAAPMIPPGPQIPPLTASPASMGQQHTV